MFCSVVVAMNIYSKTLRKEVLIQKLLQWELNAIPLFLCPPVVGEENYGNGKGEPVQMLRDRTNNTLKLQANQTSMMCVEQILSFGRFSLRTAAFSEGWPLPWRALSWWSRPTLLLQPFSTSTIHQRCVTYHAPILKEMSASLLQLSDNINELSCMELWLAS